MGATFGGGGLSVLEKGWGGLTGQNSGMRDARCVTNARGLNWGTPLDELVHILQKRGEGALNGAEPGVSRGGKDGLVSFLQEGGSFKKLLGGGGRAKKIVREKLRKMDGD